MLGVGVLTSYKVNSFKLGIKYVVLTLPLATLVKVSRANGAFFLDLTLPVCSLFCVLLFAPSFALLHLIPTFLFLSLTSQDVCYLSQMNYYFPKHG